MQLWALTLAANPNTVVLFTGNSSCTNLKLLRRPPLDQPHIASFSPSATTRHDVSRWQLLREADPERAHLHPARRLV